MQAIRLFAAFVFGGTAALASTAATAQERAPIVARAEACLRQNADRVAAAERDLHAAASFLVEYACAEEIAGAARYRRNVAYLDATRSMMKAMPNNFTKGTPVSNALSAEITARVDTETGEFILPKRDPGAAQNPIETMLPQMSMANGQLLPDIAPADLRKLAGDLVLAARERRSGRP